MGSIIGESTTTIIHQADRNLILSHPEARAFRKTARIIAIPATGPFVVETDRGPMRGDAGDWIATNHPNDDPGSDVWTISQERMSATYEPSLTLVTAPDPIALLRDARDQLKKEQDAGGRGPQDRHRANAITRLEEALLWLGASEVL